jgi:hypothetical protein
MIPFKDENSIANSIIHNTSGENEPFPNQDSKSWDNAMPKLPKSGFRLKCMRCTVDKLNDITLFHY